MKIININSQLKYVIVLFYSKIQMHLRNNNWVIIKVNLQETHVCSTNIILVIINKLSL